MGFMYDFCVGLGDESNISIFAYLHYFLDLIRVFFKDSNIILKYSILGDCFGLKTRYL